MGNRTIHVGGNAVNSVLNTGDHARIGGNIDLATEIRALREALNTLTGPDHDKMTRALDDAQDEAKKAAPDKTEVGSALTRALKYAKTAAGFADVAEKLAPHLASLGHWLGAAGSLP